MALGSHSDVISQASLGRLSVWVNKTASDIGMSAKAGNLTTTSSWIPCAGFNQATILATFTANSSATSGDITFKIEVSNDESTAYPLQTMSIGSGTATLTDIEYTRDTGNASTTFAVDFPINYKFFRIKSFAVASGDSGESYSVEVNLGTI